MALLIQHSRKGYNKEPYEYNQNKSASIFRGKRENRESGHDEFCVECGISAPFPRYHKDPALLGQYLGFYIDAPGRSVTRTYQVPWYGIRCHSRRPSISIVELRAGHRCVYVHMYTCTRRGFYRALGSAARRFFRVFNQFRSLLEDGGAQQW